MTPASSSIATIAVVSSNAFDFGEPDDESDEPIPPGLDFANFVLKRLLARGAELIVKPVSGEGGWSFDVKIAQQKFIVFIHWAPIGTPPDDRWIIQPDICKGVFRSLVGRRTTEKEVAPLVNELDHALSSAVELEKIEWVTREEFDRMY